MKNLCALGLLLAALLGTAVPASAKPKPLKQKPIEKTRRHLHQESMHRVHKMQRKS